MNTSAHTNQTRDDAATSFTRATGIGFLRRYMAGALLAATITATAVGLAATSHARPRRTGLQHWRHSHCGGACRPLAPNDRPRLQAQTLLH